MISYWGLKLALWDPSPSLSFHCGKNIYLFGPRGILQLIHESLRAINKSQIKPIMKQRRNVLRDPEIPGVSNNTTGGSGANEIHQLNPEGKLSSR